ncbi:MAG: hypothetical protein RI909_519 [Bacteroidota bacterium]
MNVPIQTLHLFLPLDQKLIELLKSLSSEDWKKPTVAKLWTVKDVAAHLLDGNIRVLALAQHYQGDPPSGINSYHDLVEYLNHLNADWVKAMKRVSPITLIELLETTQQAVIDHYHSLDLWAPARFAVSWAGEEESQNWFHIAREYTERWHHQQQIRDAVGKEGIMERNFFYPLIQTFMMALPYTYRNTEAPDGSVISVKVTGSAGGEWRLISQNKTWKFATNLDDSPDAIIEMNPDTAWKLFTKALAEDLAMDKINISGDLRLGKPILKMVSVMA